MPGTISVYLQDILEAIARVQRYTGHLAAEAFASDEKTGLCTGRRAARSVSESGNIPCPALAPHLGLGYPLAVGKPTLVSITPSVLTWAMRESGYEPDFVAGKVGVPPATLTKWLHGRDQPNLTQFRKLADTLKRTPATLLLPQPPRRPPVHVEFRRPPAAERTELTPNKRRYLREARRLRELVRWLQAEPGEELRSSESAGEGEREEFSRRGRGGRSTRS